MSHEDRETIPQVIDVIKALGRETKPGVAASKQKVELWKYNPNLVFKSGEHVVCISFSLLLLLDLIDTL